LYEPCGKSGGGIIFYYKDHISASILPDLVLLEAESLWVKITDCNSNTSTIISSIYRPPNKNWKLFCDSFIEVIDKLNIKENLVCIGDFNINFLDESYAANYLKSSFKSLNLSVLNKLPTRITDHTESLIDLIVTNNSDIFYNTNTYFEDISDHFIIYTSIKFKKNKPPRKLITKRSFKNFDPDEFFNYCKYIPFHHISDINNLDEKVEFLHSNILKALDLFAPIKTYRVRGTNKPWISTFIKNSIFFKNHAFKIARNSSDINIWNEYKLIRNATNKLVKNAKSIYYNSKLNEADKNSSQIFKIFNQIIKNPSSENWSLFINDQQSENINDIANALNKFFTASQSNLDVSCYIPSTNTNLSLPKFNFTSPSSNSILELLMKLPSSFNSNLLEIPPGILKILAPLIKEPLMIIFSQSFNDSLFCNKWKTGLIMPLKKVGNPSLPSDFRPITKVSSLSKILEKIAFIQLNDFIESNSLLSDRQFGFRKKRSIDSLIHYLTTLWRLELDKKPSPKIGLVSLDIKKAFDNVNHSLLISKLEHRFNLSSSASKWIQDYLSNRVLVTQIGNVYSFPSTVNRGIPQGGVLSPLLFNLFIDDLASNTPINNIFLYADDCLIFNQANNYDDLQIKLESDINLTLNWYTSNDLTVNATKSKILILDTKTDPQQHFQIKIGSDLVKKSSSLKYLGITLDSQLKFTNHIKILCAKANKNINLMKHIIKYIKPSATLFYSSFIRPLFESTPSLLYAISQSDSDYIEKIQNRVLKIISGVKFNKRENCNLSHIRKNLQLPLLSSRREYFFASKVFQCISGSDTLLLPLLPPYRDTTLLPSLRSCTSLFPHYSIPRYNKSQYGDRSFGYLVSKLWNSLPDELCASRNINEFKRIAKNYFFKF